LAGCNKKTISLAWASLTTQGPNPPFVSKLHKSKIIRNTRTKVHFYVLSLSHDHDQYPYVDAAVKGNKGLQCTAKVHLMLEHVEWQMKNIGGGGLGNKMEDWVEHLHQTGMRQRLHYCTVQNPAVRSLAREKLNSLNMHPDVIAQKDKINKGNKCNLVESKADLVGTLQKRQRNAERFEAMQYFKQDNVKRLTWLAPLIKNAKGKEGGVNANSTEYLCHLEKELTSTKL
jgi:hypothetical protein